MKLTAMQDLIDDLEGYLKLELSPLGLNMITIISISLYFIFLKKKQK